jgi:peptide deformylase
MVKDIVKYPTPPSVEFSVDVRVFNENIVSLIEYLKDTIISNSLDGLAAYQIGSYFNVIVVKQEDGSFLELINPRLISQNGRITTTESTAYFPELTANIERYDNISLVYQDINAKDLTLKAQGDFSVLLQRKIDYTFGTTFMQKMSESERTLFENKLEFGGDVATPESCPTTFKRDKILDLIKYIYVAMFISIIVSLFVSNETSSTVWQYEIYTAYGVLALNTIYFFYAYFEGKAYTSCVSCQLGNIIGTTVISLTKLSLLMLMSYFLVNPS